MHKDNLEAPLKEEFEDFDFTGEDSEKNDQCVPPGKGSRDSDSEEGVAVSQGRCVWNREEGEDEDAKGLTTNERRWEL